MARIVRSSIKIPSALRAGALVACLGAASLVLSPLGCAHPASDSGVAPAAAAPVSAAPNRPVTESSTPPTAAAPVAAAPPVATAGTQAERAKPTSAAPVAAKDEVYRLRPLDRLAIVFPYEPSLDEEVVVQPDGMISLPWLAPFRAEGLSSEELEAKLKRSLAESMKDPQPRVVIRSIGPRFVTVLGAVRRPGLVDLRSAPNVARAVEAAGGVADSADAQGILRIRPEAAADQRVRATPASSADASLLRHNDVVFVPSLDLDSASVHAAARAPLHKTVRAAQAPLHTTARKGENQ